MMIPKESLSGEAVRRGVEGGLGKPLGLTGTGYKCDGRLVINVVVAAVIEAQTMESVCDDLTIGGASNTLRGYLKHHLDVWDLREQAMKLSLSECLPTGLPRANCEMAIDGHHEPFYGKTPARRSYAWRSQTRHNALVSPRQLGCDVAAGALDIGSAVGVTASRVSCSGAWRGGSRLVCHPACYIWTKAGALRFTFSNSVFLPCLPVRFVGCVTANAASNGLLMGSFI